MDLQGATCSRACSAGFRVPPPAPAKEGYRTATCDKAGLPNDVCPYGQVMSASPNDVAYGNDVVPSAQWANITSLATIGSNITFA